MINLIEKLEESLNLINSTNLNSLSQREFGAVMNIRNHCQAHLLDLRYFIYNGGKVQRNEGSFCNERRGKIFSINELLNWKNNTDSSDILIHGGGVCIGDNYCFHSFDYISEELAKILRKDLKHEDLRQLNEKEFERLFQYLNYIIK